MHTWVVLLRGINVGGKNKLPMQGLRDSLTRAGCESVRTYIQSGNVVLCSAHTDPQRLAVELSSAISEDHGLSPRLIVLSDVDLLAAAQANPFPTAQAEPKSLHLFFLESAPGAGADQLNELCKDSETIVVREQVAYLHSPEGVAQSKVAQGVEKVLGVSATARNWRTVSKLLEML